MTEDIKTLQGKKMEMSQVFMLDGKLVPVTRLKMIESVDMDMENKDVVLVGTSKGKGFTGVMKKWGFAGGQATRGQSDKPRAAGSIGAQTPGRVFKGKKMAGRHGNKKITIKSVKVVKVNANEKELMVTGPVPGARNSVVFVKFI